MKGTPSPALNDVATKTSGATPFWKGGRRIRPSGTKSTADAVPCTGTLASMVGGNLEPRITAVPSLMFHRNFRWARLYLEFESILPGPKQGFRSYQIDPLAGERAWILYEAPWRGMNRAVAVSSGHPNGGTLSLGRPEVEGVRAAIQSPSY